MHMALSTGQMHGGKQQLAHKIELAIQCMKLACIFINCCAYPLPGGGTQHFGGIYICAAAKTPSSHLHSRSRAYPFNAKGSLKSSAIHSISLFC